MDINADDDIQQKNTTGGFYMMCDIKLIPPDPGELDVFVQMNQVEQVITHGGSYDDQAIDQQVIFVLDEHKQANGTKESDNEATDCNK